MLKTLTATSYTLLAHLAVQEWSAFDLAKQMTRGLDLVWPRAESAMYQEPKNLVAHGLASGRKERVGKARTRTIYAITAEGRDALADWLSVPSAPPQFESEALVRVFFAETGSKAALLSAIRSIDDHGAAIEQRLKAQITGYLRDGGPYPDRWQLIALGTRFLLDYAAVCRQWSQWAAAEADQWASIEAGAGVAPELLRDNLSRIGDRPLRSLVIPQNNLGGVQPAGPA
ncbi:MAG: PadR family transcriptional regulator [Chloroflexota bacterium]